MEKLIRPCDKEYMRRAMLKHEETFKEQVYELHRLYRIQKILMKNMEASRSIEVSQGGRNFKNGISLTQNFHHKSADEKTKTRFDLERPALEDIVDQSDSDGVVEIINETEIELTLGPSNYNRKKVETPLTSDSAHSLSSSSTGSSLINKTSCRTHHSSHTNREEISGGIIGLMQVTNPTSGCQSGIRNIYDIGEQSRQERSNQPPWFYQVLSLNMT